MLFSQCRRGLSSGTTGIGLITATQIKIRPIERGRVSSINLRPVYIVGPFEAGKARQILVPDLDALRYWDNEGQQIVREIKVVEGRVVFNATLLVYGQDKAVNLEAEQVDQKKLKARSH